SACVAARPKAEPRLRRLAERYGRTDIEYAMAATLDRTEALSRAVLSQIPQGSYTFTEYFEDDYISDVPVRIVVKLTARGHGTVDLDYTGSYPRVCPALSLPTCYINPPPLL